MKVMILAGGLGTRLGEETTLKPKPMVEIGGYPILWHIMKIYSHYGFDDFIVLTGYKSHVIKEYFVNYYQKYSDITVDLKNNSVEIHKTRNEPWKVTMLYTGQDTMTGGRIKRAREYVGNEPFMLTYGDGVSDVDINALIQSHKDSGKLCTMTAVQLARRFGVQNLVVAVVRFLRQRHFAHNRNFSPAFRRVRKHQVAAFDRPVRPLASLIEKKRPNRCFFYTCEKNRKKGVIFQTIGI